MRDEHIEDLQAEIRALTLLSLKMYEVALFESPNRAKSILDELEQYASEAKQGETASRIASHVAALVRVLRSVELHCKSAIETDSVLKRTMAAHQGGPS